MANRMKARTRGDICTPVSISTTYCGPKDEDNASPYTLEDNRYDMVCTFEYYSALTFRKGLWMHATWIKHDGYAK